MSLLSQSRLVIFSHYDVDDQVDAYVLHYLRELRSLPCDIVFVSTSTLSEIEKAKLDGLCIRVICRENNGYDFVSYRVGLLQSGVDLRSYDEVIICNDSVYGPLSPLSALFEAMGRKECDFWGIAESNSIERHLQSFFIVFKSPVIVSGKLESFFQSVECVESKLEVILRYEIGLSRSLIEQGFRYASYSASIPLYYLLRAIPVLVINKCRKKSASERYARRPIRLFLYFLLKCYSESRNILVLRKINPMLHGWRYNLMKRTPFIKIQLLRQVPPMLEAAGTIIRVIEKNTPYPTALIQGHLRRTKERYAGKYKIK